MARTRKSDPRRKSIFAESADASDENRQSADNSPEREDLATRVRRRTSGANEKPAEKRVTRSTPAKKRAAEKGEEVTVKRRRSTRLTSKDDLPMETTVPVKGAEEEDKPKKRKSKKEEDAFSFGDKPKAKKKKKKADVSPPKAKSSKAKGKGAVTEAAPAPKVSKKGKGRATNMEMWETIDEDLPLYKQKLSLLQKACDKETQEGLNRDIPAYIVKASDEVFADFQKKASSMFQSKKAVNMQPNPENIALEKKKASLSALIEAFRNEYTGWEGTSAVFDKLQKEASEQEQWLNAVDKETNLPVYLSAEDAAFFAQKPTIMSGDEIKSHIDSIIIKAGAVAQRVQQLVDVSHRASDTYGEIARSFHADSFKYYADAGNPKHLIGALASGPAQVPMET